MVRSMYSSFSTLEEVPSINLSNIKNTEEFLGTPKINLGASGWEPQTLPLCYAPPPPLSLSMFKLSFREALFGFLFVKGFIVRHSIRFGQSWGHQLAELTKVPLHSSDGHERAFLERWRQRATLTSVQRPFPPGYGEAWLGWPMFRPNRNSSTF